MLVNMARVYFARDWGGMIGGQRCIDNHLHKPVHEYVARCYQ